MDLSEKLAALHAAYTRNVQELFSSFADGRLGRDVYEASLRAFDEELPRAQLALTTAAARGLSSSVRT